MSIWRIHYQSELSHSLWLTTDYWRTDWWIWNVSGHLPCHSCSGFATWGLGQVCWLTTKKSSCSSAMIFFSMLRPTKLSLTTSSQVTNRGFSNMILKLSCNCFNESIYLLSGPRKLSKFGPIKRQWKWHFLITKELFINLLQLAKPSINIYIWMFWNDQEMMLKENV